MVLAPAGTVRHHDWPEVLDAEADRNVAAGVFQFHDKDPACHGALLASMADDA